MITNSRAELIHFNVEFSYRRCNDFISYAANNKANHLFKTFKTSITENN